MDSLFVSLPLPLLSILGPVVWLDYFSYLFQLEYRFQFENTIDSICSKDTETLRGIKKKKNIKKQK